MSAMASQITSVSIFSSIVCSGADQRKHQSSASLAFVRGIHRSLVNFPHKAPVTRKGFHMITSSCSIRWCNESVLSKLRDITFTDHELVLWRGVWPTDNNELRKRIGAKRGTLNWLLPSNYFIDKDGICKCDCLHTRTIHILFHLRAEIITFLHLVGKGNWDLSPMKTGARWSYIINTMVGDGMMTSGARVWAAWNQARAPAAPFY